MADTNPERPRYLGFRLLAQRRLANCLKLELPAVPRVLLALHGTPSQSKYCPFRCVHQTWVRSVANVVRRSWIGGASRVPDGGHRRYRRDHSRGWRLRAVCRVAAVRCDLVALGHVAGLDHLAGQRISARPTVRNRQCRTFAKLGRKEQAAPAKPRQGLTSCSSVDA